MDSPKSVKGVFRQDSHDRQRPPQDLLSRGQHERRNLKRDLKRRQEFDTLRPFAMREEIDGYLEQLNARKLRPNATSDPSVARLLNEVGNVYCRNGYLQHATERYREALSVSLTISFHNGALQTLLLSTSSHNLAVALYLRGERDSAMAIFALSLFLQRLHESRYPKSHGGSDVIQTVETMYELHWSRGDKKDARQLGHYVWDIRNLAQSISNETKGSPLIVLESLCGLAGLRNTPASRDDIRKNIRDQPCMCI
eukprot:CAMPEP_0183310846 /NCGR_PEP_ID=MMETSP0160_2-20130417/33684_1 /TAXON_ID=2839 ORGANISM="Odontella Sinensis, Strain Grunow 1884" /NCGR_SAMPLE_ID=MMETSP0160_2 /ASSEMBLY_ACC=CAM_ASM_000250 /LENGTH=253 /DNA_ID=CAMNT_0025475235 /DNA_START=201 /DNA_END=962 /DNA_ORIENTATION=-